MNTVKVRNVVIGEGRPKICVPVTGVTKKEIIEQTKVFGSIPADLAEWRADWFEDVFDLEKVMDVLRQMREILGEIPLLFTFRTLEEGGEKAADAAYYAQLNKMAAASGCVELVDIEAFAEVVPVRELIEEVHQYQVKVLASNHDFEKTPAKEEIIARLRKMQELGADISKIAVMPRSKRDVLTLLQATEEMCTEYADRPVVTMSMAEAGVISRICGEVFGSAVTFGAAQKASAPGQPDVRELDEMLAFIHCRNGKGADSNV